VLNYCSSLVIERGGGPCMKFQVFNFKPGKRKASTGKCSSGISLQFVQCLPLKSPYKIDNKLPLLLQIWLKTFPPVTFHKGSNIPSLKSPFEFHKELPLVCLVRGSMSSGLSSAPMFFIRIRSNFVIRLSTSCLS